MDRLPDLAVSHEKHLRDGTCPSDVRLQQLLPPVEQEASEPEELLSAGDVHSNELSLPLWLAAAEGTHERGAAIIPAPHFRCQLQVPASVLVGTSVERKNASGSHSHLLSGLTFHSAAAIPESAVESGVVGVKLRLASFEATKGSQKPSAGTSDSSNSHTEVSLQHNNL
jgi:hypothetical protein